MSVLRTNSTCANVNDIAENGNQRLTVMEGDLSLTRDMVVDEATTVRQAIEL
jgi:hypothetical protein